MRTMICLVAGLGLASAATAATIVVDTDKARYLTGETITVTTTLVTTGLEPKAGFALVQIFWSDPQIDGVPGPAVYGPPYGGVSAPGARDRRERGGDGVTATLS